jgi:hypothetical protein
LLTGRVVVVVASTIFFLIFFSAWVVAFLTLDDNTCLIGLSFLTRFIFFSSCFVESIWSNARHRLISSSSIVTNSCVLVGIDDWCCVEFFLLSCFFFSIVERLNLILSLCG